MEKIDRIMTRMDLPGGRSSQEGKAELRQCQTCGNTFLAKISVMCQGPELYEIGGRECPDCRQAREAQQRAEAEVARQAELKTQRQELRDKWELDSQIPVSFRDKTLANFDQSLQPKAFQVAQEYANSFPCQSPRGHSSLILFSWGYGTGKTHLAVAIAHHIFDRIIQAWDEDFVLCPVLFANGPALIRRIRATYNIAAHNGHHETEEDVYSQLRGVRLLILDDLGKEKVTEHTREVYYHIINERYQSELPVILTSNLPLEGTPSLAGLVGEATVSRLAEMTGRTIVDMSSSDYRLRSGL